MTVYLADSSVLLDLVTDDPLWAIWSQGQLKAASRNGLIAINPVIYAELCMAFERIEAVDAMLADLEIAWLELPRAALFLAGRVFLRYRRVGGTRPAILPDFFIGAHAAVAGMTLITRDRRRRGWFPTVRLIAPDP